MAFPLRLAAIRVKQPLGEFYATKIDARTLLGITYSLPLTITAPSDGDTYPMSGAQRPEDIRRLKEIGGYIETTEAAFPNSIIIGANYSMDGVLVDDEAKRWRIEDPQASGVVTIVIPTAERIATIIDGQHRLHGFEYAEGSKSMELLCAVYLDIPNPFQAYLFATINFNQKKVDRSLAYELFGFDLDKEPAESWSPEKTAVFLCRKLNVDESSPLHGHIVVAAQNDELLFANRPPDTDWAVSTATIVDGILGLISVHPKKDKDLMHQKPVGGGRSRSMLPDDKTPLRAMYKTVNDKVIFTCVRNYFDAVKAVFWQNVEQSSFIRKTIGIQALFDILKQILIRDFRDSEKKNIKVDYFKALLDPARGINFADDFFQASGTGRQRVRNSIYLATKLKEDVRIAPDEKATYERLIGMQIPPGALAQ